MHRRQVVTGEGQVKCSREDDHVLVASTRERRQRRDGHEPVVCPLRTGNVPVALTLIVSDFGWPLTGLPLLVKH